MVHKYERIRCSNMQANTEFVRAKADVLAKVLVKVKSDWSYSDNWVKRFKNRQNITFK